MSEAPAPAQPADELSAAEIARAVQVRTKYGLPASEAWIRLVAKDPSNSTIDGVPMTREEEAIVAQLILPTEALVAMIDTYSRSQPDNAGISVDGEGGLVVAYFAGDPEVHRSRLTDILPPDSRFEVVQVRYTRDELLALARQVDGEWLRTIGAKFVSSGVDTERNQVRVEISSANPAAAQAIVARYADHDRMYVVRLTDEP